MNLKRRSDHVGKEVFAEVKADRWDGTEPAPEWFKQGGRPLR